MSLPRLKWSMMADCRASTQGRRRSAAGVTRPSCNDVVVEATAAAMMHASASVGP